MAYAVIAPLEPEEVTEAEESFLSSKGRLKRVTIPEWVKKAVFYRDRGMCGYCNMDISRLVAIGNKKHFDHIVPLAQGGLNDVTNIQLLCETCNTGKGHRTTNTSARVELWCCCVLTCGFNRSQLVKVTYHISVFQKPNGGVENETRDSIQ